MIKEFKRCESGREHSPFIHSMQLRGWACLVASACCMLSMSAVAAPDAGSLGKDLTAVGAVRAGSADGAIPAWTGESTVVGTFQPGKMMRKDAWRYSSDKALYSINAANAEQYASKLTPGMLAVLKQFPGFQMDVYPTRRTCSVPDFVVENTRKNVGFAKIGADGWSLADAYVPGIPFPIPQNGVEAMWNQKLRYRGVGWVSAGGYTFVGPSKGQADWIAPQAYQSAFFSWANPGSRKLSEQGKVNVRTYFKYVTPAALAGQAAIITDYFDRPGTDAFYYFPGQRRVRRMPSYAYDAPQIGFENQYAMDETSVIMGALDRFDWKLVGKKELLVPYNSFGANDFKSDWKDVVKANGIVSNHRRYELHRVWVVEATVKAGIRHMAPKRTYYLDEDSWNAILAEDYDAQGKMTKVREGYLIPLFELNNSCDGIAFAQYNLLEGRFLSDMSAIGAGQDVVYRIQPTGAEMKPDFFTADNLRAMSER